MRLRADLLVAALAAGFLALAVTGLATRDGVSPLARVEAGSLKPSEPSERRASDAYTKLPLSFVPNRGQTDARVRFYAQGSGHAFYFTPDKVVLSFAGKKKGIALDLTPLGASPRATLEAGDRSAGKVNYLIGSERHVNLPTYHQVAYRDLWPGIDMVFRGRGGALKYEFHVRPGADPTKIALAYRGADGLAIGAAGNLLIQTPMGTLRDSRPRSYQRVDSKRVPVGSRYALNGGNTYGFALGPSYDPRHPLVIDPGLAYSTFLGGSGGAEGNAIAVDAGGSAFVTGFTGAAFPTTAGAFDTGFNGVVDGVVTKLNASGSALVYSTYLGGTGNDKGFGIAVDSAGSAYVTGSTESADFPTTAGAFDTSYNGTGDAFVSKLNSSGSGLDYSSYLGTSGGDITRAVAIDGGGSAYVTGQTFSSSFPVTAGAYDTVNSGGAFVTKFDSAGSALAYSTYLGGGSAFAIEVDTSGNAFVTGETVAGFPTTLGAFDTSHNGSLDVFALKLNSAGSALGYSTFVGGSGDDSGLGLRVDGGAAYLTGRTAPAGDFPTTVGAFDTLPNGSTDAFVSKLNAAGSGLDYSTFLGTSGPEEGRGIDVDGAGSAHVTGFTSSPAFPVTAGAFDTGHNGTDDSFVTKLNTAGSGLDYSTYLGGSSVDEGRAIALDVGGDIYVTGSTSSTTFPTTAGSFDTTLTGGTNAFVSKLDLDIPLQPTFSGTFPNSPANDNSPEVQGVADAGTTVKVYTNSTCSGTEAASGTAAAFASPGGLTVSVADNTTTTFWATATNVNGTSACSSSSITYVEDSTPPSAPTFNGTTPVSPANNNVPDVRGFAAFNSTVTLYTASDCAPETEVASGSDTTFGNPGLSVFVPDDSVTTFWAKATDLAGNSSACSSGPVGSITYTEDSATPVAPTLTDTDPDSPADDTSPEVKGTAESGSTVKLYTTSNCSGTQAASGSAATFASPGLTVSVANDSTTTFYATATDAAGNISLCSTSSITYTEDSTAPAQPTLTDTDPDSPANDTSPEVKGGAEAGSTVKIYTTSNCSGTEAASGSAAAFASPGLTVSVADDSSTTFYATATDGAGHTSSCSTSSITYTEDSTAPLAPTLTDTDPDSPSSNAAPKVKGTAESGSTVRLYTTSNCSGTEAAVGSATAFASAGLAVTVARDSTTNFRATATDAAGNASGCSTSSITYVEVSLYPRPGSATPLRVPLVPAYKQCTSPNSTHAQPLDDPSCAPAVMESTLLKTGTGGLGSAFARFRVQVGNPITPEDEANVAIDVFASDVRQSNNSDYTGQLVLATRMRITDKANGSSGEDSATAEDARFEFPVSCVDNGGTGGGTCSLTTTADALLADFAKEGKRALISALSVNLLDAGADPSITPPSGTCPPTCGSGDEKVFMRQGLLTP